MDNLDFIARLFMFIGWLFIIFKAGPELIADVKGMYREIKRPAAGTAEIQKKKHSKYIITNSCTDFHRQNLERWR